MPSQRAKQAPDILFLIVMVVAGGASLSSGLAMPTSQWEAIGSGAFPRVLGIMALVLAALKTWGVLREDTSTGLDLRRGFFGIGRIVVSFALMVIYVWVLSLGLVSFAIASAAFCVVFFALLTAETRWNVLLIALVVAVLFAFGVEFLFTRFFYIDI